MTAYLIVRAEVSEDDRDAFDNWYETEHLPDACRDFQALSAQRGWSDVTPGVHIAIYEFPTIDRARQVVASDEMKAMIAEFDRAWQDRVKRSREIVGITQAL